MEVEFPLKNFIDQIVEREGNRRAEQIDKMVMGALSTKEIGRIIVWAAKRKRMRLAKILSRIVSLELREYRDSGSMAINYDVVYAHRVIANKRIETIEQVLTI